MSGAVVDEAQTLQALDDAPRHGARQHGIGRLEQMTVSMSSPTRELLGNTGACPDAVPERVTRTESSYAFHCGEG